MCLSRVICCARLGAVKPAVKEGAPAVVPAGISVAGQKTSPAATMVVR